MIWSSLRKRTKDNLCEELRSRIDFHRTIYRESHDGYYGRAWITVDGEQFSSWSEFEKYFSNGTRPAELKGIKDWTKRAALLSKLGVYSAHDFSRFLFEYLSMRPLEAIRSEIPLLRALAVGDRRIGKRTLFGFNIDLEQDPVVQLFYRLRVGGSDHSIPR